MGVLKWRFQTADESNIPLSSESSEFPDLVKVDKQLFLGACLFFLPVNCWPSDNGQGGCDVNIEYELEQAQLELNDVIISIPIP